MDNMHLTPMELESMREILSAWQAAFPDMGVLALLPEAEKDRLPVLQAACRELGVPLAGGIFPALVTESGFISDGAWLLRLDHSMPAILIPALNAGGGAADRIADAIQPLLASQADEVPTLYMLFDSQVPNIASVLEDLYLRLSNRVAYAGVNAGSESFQPMPCLFDNEGLVGDGVLCLLLSGMAGTVLQHGYTAPEQVMSATSTKGNCIRQIDWRPAFDVYREIIRTAYGIELTRENFYQYAVHFPVGILRASAEVVVRIPVALTEDGSLFCVGEVPENSFLVLLKAPDVAGGHCIQDLAASLGELNGAMLARPLLAFYCAGRRMHLGPSAVTELGELALATGAHPIAGALSLGEIGSTHEWGYPMFHNATLVCTPWGMP